MWFVWWKYYVNCKEQKTVWKKEIVVFTTIFSLFNNVFISCPGQCLYILAYNICTNNIVTALFRLFFPIYRLSAVARGWKFGFYPAECKSSVLRNWSCIYLWHFHFFIPIENWKDNVLVLLTLSKTSPCFYLFALQVFLKHCRKRRNCS